MVDDAAAALKDCIRVKRGSCALVLLRRSFYSGGVRYVIAVSPRLSRVHLQTREMNTREQIAPLIEGRWIWDCCVTQRYRRRLNTQYRP